MYNLRVCSVSVSLCHADEVGLYTAGAGVVLGSVTVDWVEDELYWIESQATSSTVRLIYRRWSAVLSVLNS